MNFNKNYGKTLDKGNKIVYNILYARNTNA